MWEEARYLTKIMTQKRMDKGLANLQFALAAVSVLIFRTRCLY